MFQYFDLKIIVKRTSNAFRVKCEFDYASRPFLRKTDDL